MEAGIPDFSKDWTELEGDGEEIFLSDGESLFKSKYYVRFEPINSIFDGLCIFFYGKETVKVWTESDPSGKGYRKLVAMLLENGEWVLSVPIYKDTDFSKLFYYEENVKDSSFKIYLLTGSGWKSRVLKRG